MLGEELMSWIAYFELVHEAEKKAMDEAKKGAEDQSKNRETGRGRAPGRDRTMGSHNARRDNRVPLK